MTACVRGDVTRLVSKTTAAALLRILGNISLSSLMIMSCAQFNLPALSRGKKSQTAVEPFRSVFKDLEVRQRSRGPGVPVPFQL